MKRDSLLLQRHTGGRPVRAQEGRVIAATSNQRWSLDGLAISCWNGEVVQESSPSMNKAVLLQSVPVRSTP